MKLQILSVLKQIFLKTKRYIFWFFISFLGLFILFLGILVGIACYFGGFNFFPLTLVIIAGIVDGINPCAIGVMLLLLGYLLIFLEKKKEVLKIGIIYIITVYLTYLVIGLFFAEFIHTLSASPLGLYFQKTIGILLILAAVLNIKDFFFEGRGPTLQIPQRSRKYISSLVEKGSVPATIGLGVVVTFLETPCSFPLYMGTISVLELSFKKAISFLFYLLIYNFMFVLPLLAILYLVYFARKLTSLKEFQHHGKRWLRLISGLVILAFGIFIIFFI